MRKQPACVAAESLRFSGKDVMLRVVAQRSCRGGARAFSAVSAWKDPASGAPTVAEKTVHITFVNFEGNRKTVPVFVGQNLLQIAREHDVELDGPCNGGGSPPEARRSSKWTEELFGSGPSCYYCHVLIPREYASKVAPPYPREVELMEQSLGSDYAPGASRLGCQVTITPEMDGMSIFIPDGEPCDCP